MLLHMIRNQQPPQCFYPLQLYYTIYMIMPCNECRNRSSSNSWNQVLSVIIIRQPLLFLSIGYKISATLLLISIYFMTSTSLVHVKSDFLDERLPSFVFLRQQNQRTHMYIAMLSHWLHILTTNALLLTTLLPYTMDDMHLCARFKALILLFVYPFLYL